MSGYERESDRVIQELSTTRIQSVGFVLPVLLYGSALSFHSSWWAYMCMWTCLGREAKVKVKVGGQRTGS